jgi:ferredoxin-NADP reductase
VTEIASAAMAPAGSEPGQLGRPRPDNEPAPIGGWSTAKVVEVSHPTPRSVMLRLDVPDRVDHLPGQHYVIRLTADDGYVAQRSYSIASAPSDPLIELWIERLEDGEVSGFLADVVEPGDDLEVRGPIGGWFVWDGGTPALLVAGGFGVVPVVSMLRTAHDLDTTDLLRVAASGRTLAGLPYAEELVAAGALIVLTREGRGLRPAGRLTEADLVPLWEPGQTAYVCGSAAFAEAASQLVVGMGFPPGRVRVERFGPSGS